MVINRLNHLGGLKLLVQEGLSYEGCSHGDNLKSKKKNMFVEYLSNLSNAGALRAPVLL
jgi:hypothetical protein